MKKYNKLISLLLAVVMLLSCTPAMAASVGSIASDKNVGEDTAQGAKTAYDEVGVGSSKTNVYLTVDSSNVIVGVPVEVIVNGTPNEKGEYIGNYSVVVKGDFPGNETISITPEDDVILKQEGKADIVASISQDKLDFSYSDVISGNNTSDGRITASTLTAGSWNGEFTFRISTAKDVVPNGYTVLYRYDLSATENDNVAAYYCVPNKNTEPIKSNDSSSSVTALMKSLFNPIVAYAAEGENVIEHGDTRYYLSDADTLVISGTGEMKEEIARELYGIEGIYNDIAEKYNACIKESILAAGLTISTETLLNNSCIIRFVPGTTTIFDVVKIDRDVINDYISSGRITSSTPGISVSIEGMNGINNGFYEYLSMMSKSEVQEIQNYIDSIKDNYIISMPKTVIVENGVTNISNRAFYECTSLENITLSNTLTSIGEYAFYNCINLNNVYIPENITTIKQFAFSGCTNLTDISVSNNNSIESISNGALNYTAYATDEKNFENGLVYLGNLLINASDITNAVVKDGTKFVGGFSFNSGLTSITLPDGLEVIGENTFRNCSSLTSVVIPNSVELINDYAFSGCKKLGTITIPNNVISIGNGAFQNCKLTSITIPDSVTSIGESAFNNCSSLKTVLLPGSIKSIGNSAFYQIGLSAKIYCETQNTSDLLVDGNHYQSSKSVTVVVDASKFI